MSTGALLIMGIHPALNPIFWNAPAGPLSFGESSHMVSLQTNGQHCCNGIIIGPQTVLTASNCKYCLIDDSQIIKARSLNSQETEHTVYFSESYSRSECGGDMPLCNDLMILNVEPSFNLNVIKPIKIAEKDAKPGDQATIQWFQYNPTKTSLQLLFAKTTIMDRQKCANLYRNSNGGIVTDEYICTGLSYNSDKSYCFGGPGAPVIVNGRLSGMASTLLGCEHLKLPALYTNIEKYSDWIMKSIK